MIRAPVDDVQKDAQPSPTGAPTPTDPRLVVLFKKILAHADAKHPNPTDLAAQASPDTPGLVGGVGGADLAAQVGKEALAPRQTAGAQAAIGAEPLQHRHDQSALLREGAAAPVHMAAAAPPSHPTPPSTHLGVAEAIELNDRADLVWAKAENSALQLQFPAGMPLASLEVLAQAGRLGDMTVVAATGYTDQVTADLERLRRRLADKGLTPSSLKVVSQNSNPDRAKPS